MQTRAPIRSQLASVGERHQHQRHRAEVRRRGRDQLASFRFDLADFDIGEMLTFSWNPSSQGDGISHASVFSNTVTASSSSIGSTPGSATPEPGTAALSLFGLGLIGASLAGRRRKTKG